MTRRLLIVGLLGGIALAALNFANLVGAGYGRYASARLDRPESPATAAAARIAARWSPWSSPHAALHGWVLTEGRDASAVEDAYLKALRLAPGDPLLWSEYALALARLNRFDAAMTVAVRKAQQLAPSSSAVRRTLADMGLSYWSRGTPEQRALWLVDMRRELKHNRDAFLAHVLARGRGRTFCRNPAVELGEQDWCSAVATTLLASPR
ncbi:MAG TPA: hypothetical protein VM240_08100 [Verrucomicrobiae bacterium]|nr:hypothetical protein [Verrucomicrobiae bacterium]